MEYMWNMVVPTPIDLMKTHKQPVANTCLIFCIHEKGNKMSFTICKIKVGRSMN